MENLKKYFLIFFIYMAIGPSLGSLPFMAFFSISPLLTFSLEGLSVYFAASIVILCIGYIIGGPVALLAVCMKFYQMKTGKLKDVTRFLIMLMGCFFIIFGGSYYKYPVEYAFFLASVLCLPYCLLSMFAASACDAIVRKVEKRHAKKSLS